MPTEVVSALIAAIVSVLGTIVTLTISLRTTRIDNDRLQNERQRLEHELKIGREKLQVERTRLEHELHFESERLANEGQRLKFELQRNEDTITMTRAELFKLKVETEKIKLEANELIRNRIAPERTEIRDLLILFERAAFDAPFSSEEPSAMYRAIQQTRISLQTAGASLASNQEVAESFRAARKSILDVEYQIESRFPKVAQLAHELGDQPVTPERRSKVEQVLGQEGYWESVRLMMSVRKDISPHIEKIREVLRELDKQMKLQ